MPPDISDVSDRLARVEQKLEDLKVDNAANWENLYSRMDADDAKRYCKSHSELLFNMNSRLATVDSQTRDNTKAIDGIIAKLWAVLVLVIGAIVTAIFGLFKN